MSTQSNQKYFAFISYQREDEKWAKWLQHKLEYYHLPSTANGKELPGNMRYVFRDIDELKVGGLEPQIYDALQRSQNLIIICSPNAAKSKWVNKEISDFIAMGRAHRIFPFIIAGAPHTKDSNECFPPALEALPSQEERVGANITEGGRDFAAVKLIAGVVDIDVNDLWHRYERERRRRRLLWTLAAALMIALSVGVALWMWRMNTTLERQNRTLTIESIKSGSSEVIAMVERGEYIQAIYRLVPLIALWKDKYREEAPIFEQALRAVYHTTTPDVAMQTYTTPLSLKQNVLDADSDYFYVRDASERQVLRYDMNSGELADTIFPARPKHEGAYIEDVKKGRILYTITDSTQANGKTRYLYDSHTKKEYRFLECGATAQFISEDYIITEPYEQGGSYLYRIQKDGIHKVDKPCLPYYTTTTAIWGDTLVVTDGCKVWAWSISKHQDLYTIDYDKGDNYIITICCSNICPRTKMFAYQHYDKGFLLQSAECDSVLVLDSTRDFSTAAINDDGSTVVARVSNSDSIFVFTNGQCVGTVSIPQLGWLQFASSRDLLLLSEGQISHFLMAKPFKLHGLYANDGYSFFDFYSDDVSYLGNDTITDNYLKVTFDSPYSFDIDGFTPQSSYFTLAANQSINLLDFRNQKVAFRSEHPKMQGWGSSRQVSEDEKTVMLCTTDSVFFFSTDSLRLTRLPRLYYGRNETLGPDGRLVAMNYESNIIICDTASWQAPILMIPDPQERNAVVTKFTPDGKRLLVSFTDGSLELWDIEEKTLAAPVTKLISQSFSSMDISPDGQYALGVERQILTGKWAVYVWHLSTGQLVDCIPMDWATTLYKIRGGKGDLHFTASFARSGKPAIIVNEATVSGLSRVYSFPSFEEILKELGS